MLTNSYQLLKTYWLKVSFGHHEFINTDAWSSVSSSFLKLLRSENTTCFVIAPAAASEFVSEF